MLGLRDYQRTIGASILSGYTGEAAQLIENIGGVASADRLQIHRNTMLTALSNALALTYPAVEALVGAEFFTQTAREFVQAYPPRAALLTLYGGEFPDFLSRHRLLDGLPYLADVARLEWAVEQAARAPTDDDTPPLADIDLGGTRLALAPSLSLLQVGYRAEAIWRAVLDNDGDALSRIDTGPVTSMLAIWRSGDGAAVASLGAASASFLEELIAGGDAETAINAAAAADPAGDPIVAISSEILPAGFARLSPET
jgi:hypothetical protein